ncbi:MAG: polysaccharide pyruvyl transferase CsaB [Clostridiales bacterium]|nr:polysaccharide pyruvyl transferase CsaB [Clostridiales bacterium]
MYKILISGYYGFNNIGDESILKAVVDNLRERLEGIEVTVLSQSPASTTEKYGVRSANRKSVRAIISETKRCDLLISGGGSLLQDVTSRRSIVYYLAIMRLARFMGKKVMIYSQGIGPINSEKNRKLTAKVLQKVDGIVVRDDSSKKLLTEIGIDPGSITVTADPVLRVKPVSKSKGRQILEGEGFSKSSGKPTVGFAIRERNRDEAFINELCISMERLIEEQNAQIVLIPFHYSEDMPFIEEIEKRLGGRVFTVKHKYLTEEMLSIIGNMDVLVGVRLHALIHAAIMDVSMIAVSYDPKINSFMHSVGMKAMCSIYDFTSEFFMEEFSKVTKSGEKTRETVQLRIKELIKKLESNEEIIKKLMEE